MSYSHSPTPTGETILHYQVAGKLGAGGMGVVFKALDLRLKRFVALKFLPSDLPFDATQRARLLREATAASALEHPNIGAVHAIEETRDGLLFIVMSYYEGETLKQRLERSPLAKPEVYDIALQTARGLAEAHRKGIIHRDIKPSNLMLTPQGVVKIVDFGLAKIQGGVDLTQSMVTMGTAAYMSPEQALAKLVDNRSDIWSFGVMLHEMLTGRLPFHGDSATALLFAVVNSDLPPLSELSPPLRKIVRKCLSKSPAERYPTMEEVIADLERVAQGNVPEEETSPLPPPSVVLESPSSGSPIAIWVGTAAAVVVLAGGGWLMTRNPSAPKVPAETPPTRAAAPAPNTAPTPAPPAAKQIQSKAVQAPKRTAEVHKPPEPAPYNGPKDGRLVWVGELDPAQVLDLAANSSSGTVSGMLPGVPVSIEIHPDTVHAITPPGAENRWRSLVVRNDGKRQVTVVVSWHVVLH